MKYKMGLTFAAAAVASFALVGPGAADSSFKNKYDDVGASEDCGDGDVIEYAGPLKMWPPNHKLQDVAVTATDGGPTAPSNPLAESTSLMVTVNPLDAVGGDGGPQHDPDFMWGESGPSSSGTPSATVPFQLRSERSGRGDGRTYQIIVNATFDHGAKTCDWTFDVVVPHDMRGGADWKS